MEKFFSAIIRKRKLVLVIAAIALAASVISLTQTRLNSDLAQYLPDDSISKQTIRILRDHFNVNGDAVICAEGGLENYDELSALADELSALDEVHELQWLGSYADMFSIEDGKIISASEMLPDENVHKLIKDMYFDFEGKSYYLITISLTAANATAEAGEALELIDGIFAKYSLPYELGGNSVQSNDMLKSALGDVPMFIIVAFTVILIILLLTSPSAVSALIFLLTIGISIVYNLGTNFFTEDISTVTFSVAAILQLALSMDYSIFLTHSFESARKEMDDEAAMVLALRKTITVIAASALTTMAGFCALFAMKYTMGFDLGLCLAKGVAFSFLTVIIVQPCLMLSLKKASDKTRHKFLSPDFEKLSHLPGRLAPWALAIVFILLIPASYLGNAVEYYYLDSGYDSGASGIEGASQSVGTQTVLVVETVSAEKQLELTEKLRALEGVNSITGFYPLIADLTDGISVPIYSSFTEKNPDNLMFYLEPTPLDIVNISEGDTSSLEAQIEARLTEYMAGSIGGGAYSSVMVTQEELEAQAKDLAENVVEPQLEVLQDEMGGFTGSFASYKDKFFADIDGTEYTFIIMNIAGEPEGQAALDTVDAVSRTAKYVLGTDTVYISGNTQTVSDLMQTTQRDFTLISIVSALAILVILLFTFRDLLVSLLLILVIELAIFINLSVSCVMGTSLNFISYVIISAIQLGATIDYAILMTKSFLTELESAGPAEAIGRAVRSCAFPITVSVSILCGACLSVYFISTDKIIKEITMLIARGAFISGLLVELILPALLLFLTQTRIDLKRISKK